MAGVEMLPLDLRSSESIRECADAALERCGGIDVLINNAGRMHRGFAEETTPAEAAEVFAANFFGTTELIHEVLPAMRARRRGLVINVGSLGAWVGEPGEAFYSASKAALARYTEALRQEVWHCGIRVCLVEPGAFTTGVLDAASTSAPSVPDYDGPRESVSRVFQRALNKGADPSTVASLIWRIATTDSRRLRYTAGSEGRWLPLAKVLLPQALLDSLLRRRFRLPR